MRVDDKGFGFMQMVQMMCEEKRSEQYIGLGDVGVTILVAVILVSSFFAPSMLNQSSTRQIMDSVLQVKAAIVDQLSLTYPNQTFIQTAINILRRAGYTVDYCPGENATVEFYRKLLAGGYSVIIFRVHSTGGPTFFTSEPYSISSHFKEQLLDLVSKVSYYRGGLSYFAIPPSFVRAYMDVRLHKAIVIAMGCFGLESNDMAEAFTENKANIYIGWSGPVSASHTDSAIANLLEHLFVGKQTVREAICQTMQEIGADPTYNSTLLAFPSGDATMESTRNKRNDEETQPRKGVRSIPR